MPARQLYGMQRKILGDELPTYVCELVSGVLDRTGYPLLLSEEPGIGYDSELRVARPSRCVHEVAYVPEYREYRVHFLVNGAFKILRLWDMPQEERYVPATEVRKGLPLEDFVELRNKLPDFPRDQLEQVLSKFLYQGIIRQLTSMPVDIRVEKELAEALPEHWEAQKAYLERQVRDLEPTFLPEMEKFCPEKLYSASTAMNVVLADEAAEIAGVPVSRRIKETSCRPLGEKLREVLHSVQEPACRGDRLATDAWARELGLEGWYEWVRLEGLE